MIERETGLARGESSFIDWRDQSYPRWMEPDVDNMDIDINDFKIKSLRLTEL